VADAGPPQSSIEIVCARSGRTLTVPPGKSILNVLDENGVRVRRSCRKGICGTCETKVLEGIPDHRDKVFTDEQRAANDRMTVCVSRALTPRLVLDL
jgi:ferredoxin